jgi:tRNA uridine 5-carboxymethylaminomethyl modification enzyme
MKTNYDVIVVGGGHAGCEAAAAAATMGSSTLLITMNMQTIGQMSCNPAMGGIAKGQIIREIDALGGLSGIVTDKTMIQFRMLNTSKGPAMWSPRAQNDRWRFSEEWRLQLEKLENLDFFQDMCTGLVVEGSKIKGVKTSLGIQFSASSVVLTNGTFLNGIIHIGEKSFGGGRAGEKAATGITEDLNALGFESGRMKTGTPPRIDGRSLDYSKFEEQKGDLFPGKFSYSNTVPLKNQMSCWIAYTTPGVHEILRKGFDKSPMFNGTIKGAGPRYCPSIEDKIERFADRDRHQLFIEPEGWNTVEMYINGFSTSLPFEVQVSALKGILGFEHVKLFRPGYAIEYDYFPPTQLNHTLETKTIEGLFFAGQINGTTGYEEAACQGLIAGINAHAKSNSQAPFVLSRDEAYIGVLIDDLVSKGTDEPYRMFTSRAEFRLSLRQDNADLRLTHKGYGLGLVSKEHHYDVLSRESEILSLRDECSRIKVAPLEINQLLVDRGENQITEQVALDKLLLRPGLTYEDCRNVLEHNGMRLSDLTFTTLITSIRYMGYIKREQESVLKQKSLEGLIIPDSFDFNRVEGLSNEAKIKLGRQRPKSVGHASRISGVSPSDVSVLLVYMGR